MVYRPKPKGEQRFVDKHVTVKHKDRNGNGDDVFKATNIEPEDREEGRHGYNKGTDDKVYEEVRKALIEYFESNDVEITDEELHEVTLDSIAGVLYDLDENKSTLSYFSGKNTTPSNLDIALNFVSNLEEDIDTISDFEHITECLENAVSATQLTNVIEFYKGLDEETQFIFLDLVTEDINEAIKFVMENS